jgi:hypothetical protein
MMDLFTDKFARLRARRFSFLCVLAGPPDRLFFGHFASSENILPVASLGMCPRRNQSMKSRKPAKSFLRSETLKK